MLQTGGLLHLSQASGKILLHLLHCGCVLWKNEGNRTSSRGGKRWHWLWWVKCLRIKPEKGSRQIVTGECDLASPSESSEVLAECWNTLHLWDGAVSGSVLAGNRCKAGAESWAGLREPAKMGMGPGTSKSGEPSAPLGVGRYGRESCHQGLMRAGAI